MTATDLRWHVVAGWCLIRLNFYFGGLDAAHIFEQGAQNERTVEELAAWRRRVEPAAGSIWAGFAAFCHDVLEADPVEVIRATYPHLEVELPMLQSFEIDWAEATKCRDEFIDVWRDLREVNDG